MEASDFKVKLAASGLNYIRIKIANIEDINKCPEIYKGRWELLFPIDEPEEIRAKGRRNYINVRLLPEDESDIRYPRAVGVRRNEFVVEGRHLDLKEAAKEKLSYYVFRFFSPNAVDLAFDKLKRQIEKSKISYESGRIVGKEKIPVYALSVRIDPIRINTPINTRYWKEKLEL